MEQMLDYYDQKYGVLDDKLYQILKSIDYFVDADRQVMPEMLIPIKWEEIKKYFRQETNKLTKKKLQL